MHPTIQRTSYGLELALGEAPGTANGVAAQAVAAAGKR